MNIERDKFLTEAMGQCWHDEYTREKNAHPSNQHPSWDIAVCKCGLGLGQYVRVNDCSAWKERHDFSTWIGFGLLWEWAQKQEWFGNFCTQYSRENLRKFWLFDVFFPIIHPDKFADALYEYLKSHPIG